MPRCALAPNPACALVRVLTLLLCAAAAPLIVSGQPEAPEAGPEAASQQVEPVAPAEAAAAAEPAARLGYREAFILGLVEGITEYLPISSTGHLLLTNELLGLNDDTPLPSRGGDGATYTLRQAADTYAIVIQGGAILAVVLLYWKRLWGIAMGFLGRDAAGLRLGRNLIVAFLPAAVLGLLLDDLIEAHLFAPLPIAIALIFGAFLMLGVEGWRRRRGDLREGPDLPELSIRQCLTIGFLQCVAMWPGTSRSMMTIVGGYVAGLSPTRAAEFSFLLGLITLTAASGYKLVKDGEALFAVLDLGPMLFGIAVATVAAALAIHWLVRYLSRHGLALFAWYRLALAALVLIFLV